MTENSLQIENLKLKIVFFGTPEFVIPVAKSLAEHFDLVGVVTTPDSPQGRKKVLTPSPIKKWYMQYLLDNNKEGVILTPDTLTKEVAIKLTKLHADMFVTAAYGKLIPKRILTIPPLGALNIHPSTLPKFRGPSPIQYTLLSGEKELGTSIMLMDEELDHGPILTQWRIPIDPKDTFASLHVKAFSEGAARLPDLIKKYQSGEIKPTPQDHTKATFTKKIEKQDGFFSLDNPPPEETLQQMIHAYYPWPTAWSMITLSGKELRMKILPEKKVQLEGGKPMTVSDFLNGYPEARSKLSYVLSLL